MNLKHIELNIWKACNNKCRFCMSSKSSLWDIKFVSLDILKKKIKLYADKWYNSIWFLWWDISIHPNILEIVKFCKQNNFENINVITNWMVFDNEEFANSLIESWVTRINISIHSHINKIEDYLTRVKWWLQRKLKAIDNFNKLYNSWKLRDALSINIVVNKKNYKNIVETCLYFWKEKNINDIRINFIRLNKDVKENWDDLKLSYTEFLPYLKKLVYISIKYKIRITFDTIPACIFYKIDKKNYKVIIKKFLWEDLDHIVEIDHINKNDNFDWKKRKKDIFKTQFKNCEFCIYRESCQWVRKEYWMIYWWEEFKPIKLDKNIKLYKTNKLLNNDVHKDLLNKKVKYFYNQLNRWNLSIWKKIEELYKNNNDDNKIMLIYSLYLQKKWKFRESLKLLLQVLSKKDIGISLIGHIYYNIAVNYSKLNDNINTEKYLLKAKKYIWNKDYFKKFYN